MITYEDFAKLEIKIGTIISAERVEGSEKLLKLSVDLGEKSETGLPTGRQVIAGIAKSYEPESLIGKQVLVLINLEPRMIMSLESQGMILAADSPAGPVLLSPEKEVPSGSVVK